MLLIIGVLRYGDETDGLGRHLPRRLALLERVRVHARAQIHELHICGLIWHLDSAGLLNLGLSYQVGLRGVLKVVLGINVHLSVSWGCDQF